MHDGTPSCADVPGHMRRTPLPLGFTLQSTALFLFLTMTGLKQVKRLARQRPLLDQAFFIQLYL